MSRFVPRFCPSLVVALAVGAAALRGAPTIVTQPDATVVVTSGQQAVIGGVQAQCTGPLRWQWRRMGAPLSGQTGPGLVLPAATMADAGYYDLVITDDTGSVTTRPSRILVTPVGGYPDTLRLDTSFNPTFERKGASIGSIAVSPGGEVYLAGDFTRVADEPIAGLARFSPDLVVDSSFRPLIVGSAGAVLVQADGKVVVQASLRLGAGNVVGPLVRLNWDGSNDEGFSVPDFRRASGSVGITALALQSDQRILVAGSFNSVGLLQRTGLARLNADGSPDQTFSPNLGPAPYISRIAISGSKIVLLGSFELSPRVYTQLVRLKSDGTVDSAFAPSSTVGSAYGMLSAGKDGRVYVGAPFATGEHQQGDTIVRLQEDGSLDSGFVCALDVYPHYGVALADGGIAAVWDSKGSWFFGRLGPAGALMFSEEFRDSNGLGGVAVSADNRLYFGGVSAAENSPFVGGAACYTPEGIRSCSVAGGIRTSAIADCAIPARGGKWVVTGQFSYVNGTPAPGIARLNADGTTDTDFRATSPSLPTLSDLVAQGDGAILAVAGGAMVARRLLPNGQIDPSFAFNAGSGFGSSTPGNMAVLADGRIAASGWLSTYNGETINAGLIVIQANGTRDTSFAPIFQTTSYPFNRLVAAPGGGFAFSGSLWLEGYAVPLLWMAPLWGWIYPQSLGQGSSSEYGVGFDASGRLLVARDSSCGFSRFDQYGSLVPPGPAPAHIWVSFTGAAITTQTDNRVLIEGSCSPSAHGLTYGPLVRLNADDSLDTTFRIADLIDTYTPLPRASMQYTDDGRLLMCGAYGVRDGIGISGLVMFKPEALPPPPVITQQPVSITARLGDAIVLSVEASGEILSYRWYHDGSPKAIGRTLVLPAVAASDFGSYTAEVLGPGGSVMSNSVTVAERLALSFADWIAASDVPLGQHGELDTPAGDGVSNLMKYALGVPPMASAGTLLPSLTLVEKPGQPPALALVFAKNPDAEGIRYALETSADLVTWAEADVVTESFGVNAVGTALVRMRESAPSSTTRRFVRLKVVIAASP